MLVGHMVGHVAEIFTTAACIYLGGASSICAVAGKVVHEFIIEPLVDTFFYNKTFNYNTDVSFTTLVIISAASLPLTYASTEAIKVGYLKFNQKEISRAGEVLVECVTSFISFTLSENIVEQAQDYIGYNKLDEL